MRLKNIRINFKPAYNYKNEIETFKYMDQIKTYL